MSYVTTVVTTYLRTAARRRRTYVLRTMLALTAFAVIIYYLKSHVHDIAEFSAFHGFYIDLSHYGRRILARFLMVLMGGVIILTPAYCGPIISQEREKKTLDLLLSTPLSRFRMILGKMISRLQLIIFIIIGMIPLSFFCLMFGGISPKQIILGVAPAVSTVLLFAGISILVSAASRSSSSVQTIIYSYLMILLCGILIYGAVVLLGLFFPFRSYFVGRIFMVVLVWVNPIILFIQFYNSLRHGLALPVAPFITCFAVSLSFFFAAIVISGRSIAGEETRFKKKLRRVRDSGLLLDGFRKRPDRKHYPVLSLPKESNPVYWREINESMFGRKSGIASSLLIVLAPFLMLVYISSLILTPEIWHGSHMHRELASAYRFHSGFIAFEFAFAVFYLLLLCSAAFTKERSRKTLESLLTSGLSNCEIIKGKLFGAWRKSAYLFMWPVIHLLLSVFHGVYDPVTIILAFMTIFSISFFLSTAGISSSALARNSTQAVILSTAVAIVAFLAPSLYPSLELAYRGMPYLNPLVWLLNPDAVYKASGGASQMRFHVLFNIGPVVMFYGFYACLCAIYTLLGIGILARLGHRLREILLRENWKGAVT